MNLEKVTIEDCIEMYEKKSMAVSLENGRVTGFVEVKEDAA